MKFCLHKRPNQIRLTALLRRTGGQTRGIDIALQLERKTRSFGDESHAPVRTEGKIVAPEMSGGGGGGGGRREVQRSGGNWERRIGVEMFVKLGLIARGGATAGCVKRANEIFLKGEKGRESRGLDEARAQ